MGTIEEFVGNILEVTARIIHISVQDLNMEVASINEVYFRVTKWISHELRFRSKSFHIDS